MTIVSIGRETGLTYNAVASAARVLRASGLIREIPTGGAVVYAPVPDHPFSAPLAQLFAAERERRRAIQVAVQEWAEEQPTTLLCVWLFGSVARREDTFESDVDLAVVAAERADARMHADAMRMMLSSVAEQQKLRPNVLSYDTEEIRALPSEDPEMWNNLVRDAVTLHGLNPTALRQNLDQSDGREGPS